MNWNDEMDEEFDCLAHLRSEDEVASVREELTEEDHAQVEKLQPILDHRPYTPVEFLIYDWSGEVLEYELDTDFITGVEITNDSIGVEFILTDEALAMKNSLKGLLSIPKVVNVMLVNSRGKAYIAEGSVQYNGNYTTTFATHLTENTLFIRLSAKQTGITLIPFELEENN